MLTTRVHRWQARGGLRALLALRRAARGFATSADLPASLPSDHTLTPREVGLYMNENLARFAPDSIRNFSIVAHIDHGKSVSWLFGMARSDATLWLIVAVCCCDRRSRIDCSRSAAISPRVSASRRRSSTRSRFGLQ